MSVKDETEPTAGADWIRRPWLWVGVVAGLVVWIATMARYPRYSDGVNESTGSPTLFPLLAGTAFILGYVEPRRPRHLAAALIAPCLVLAPWTTPRGDGDGLWGLIFPMLIGFAFVLAWCADRGSGARRRVDGWRGE